MYITFLQIVGDPLAWHDQMVDLGFSDIRIRCRAGRICIEGYRHA